MKGRLICLTLLLVVTACATSPGDAYQRHSHSRLVPVEGSSSEFVFASRADVVPTDADANAEAVRLRWISEWLAIRGACAAGHEVVDQRPFGPMEYNPAMADLRYLVRCRAAPVETETGQ